MSHHEIDLLLECTCIVIEPLEAAIFIPMPGTKRICNKHGETVIKKVGYPYWVNDDEKQEIKSPS